MQDLIGKLMSAIATGEGFFFPGSLPAKNHNPGDLRAAPWLFHPVIKGGFWMAESDAQGIAGGMHQIALDIARGDSLRELISKWAPPSDGNNTENYINETARRIGMAHADINKPLWNFLEIEHIP